MSLTSEEESSLVIVERTNSMSTMDGPPELIDECNAVELAEIKGPSPYQIVSIGSEQDAYAFAFDKEKLLTVLAKVPASANVAVVSVVGAFRTGKSFLLSWFLRYLDYRTSLTKEERTSSSTTTTSTGTGTPWYKTFDSLGKDGFSWKGGEDRNTTGIWMWSEPYLLRDDLAVLLIDTQGMFDHDTTMELTASIFGLSTLLSSLLIYNVDKQVQEDNLQQLALFSEYARMGVGESDETEKKEKESTIEVNDEGNISVVSDQPKPFQQIEFLVRDWQHFDEVDVDAGNLEKLEGSMKKYIDKVLASRNAKDLQDTREHILNCFEKITCYGLCYPGSAVPKKSYSGEIDVLDETFLNLLARYCERVFDPENLKAKEIHGQVLTAEQLGVFMQAYADMFASGAKFPPAGTMLEATANANNTNATHLGITKYKQEMDRIAGPACSSYVNPEELKKDHAKIRQESLRAFAAMANFGSKKNIAAARKELQQEIDSFFTYYESLNESRNPLAGLELYLVPSGVAVVSYSLRMLTDATCSATMCRSASEAFSHAYLVFGFFILIIAGTKFKQIKDSFFRLQQALEVMTNEKVKKD